MNMRKLAWMLVLFPLAAQAGGASSDVTPPSTRLQPGQWSYHSTVKVESGLGAGRPIEKNWKTCLENDADVIRDLAPRGQHGNVKCSKPTLQYDKTRYHTTMTCTLQSHGIDSTMTEDFILVPGHDGKTFQATGTVDQQLDIPGMPARHVHTGIEVRGQRIGKCPGR